MGRASSSKKVARAASTGGGRTTRGARPLGWYAAIVLVVVLGVSGIVFSRAERRQELAAGTDLTAPAPGRDHWHAAYGFYLCDKFVPNLGDVSGGIHSHSDGLIHVEPLTRREGGKNATLGRFLEAAGVELTDDLVQVPGGKKFEEGKTKCGGKAATLTVKVDDKVMTTGFSAVRLKDGQIITIAFAPEGADAPEPPSVPELSKQGPAPGAPGAPVQVPVDPNAVTDPNAPPAAEGAPAAEPPPADGGATPTSAP